MQILVVDSDATIVESIGGGLRQFGHRVDGANSGRAALEMVRATGQPGYDALVLAWSLPDLSGAEVHVRVWELDRKLADHTLFLSDHPGLWPLRQGGRLISRPSDPARLADRIEALVDGRLPRPRRATVSIGATIRGVPIGFTSPPGGPRR